MSTKMFNKGSSSGRNENIQRKILPHNNTVQKFAVSCSVSRPSPILSDKNEFPSLSENTERQPSNLSSSGGPLTYSDKLKLSSSSPRSFLQVPPSKTNLVGTSTSDQVDPNVRTGIKPKKSFDKIKTRVDLNQNINKKSLGESLSSSEQHWHSNDKNSDNKMRKQSNFNYTSNHRDRSSKTSPLASNNTNQNQSNKLPKSASEASESKEEADNAKTKKKKKRKSKVKRQVALQTGKITVLPPEVHSKILNQRNTLSNDTQNFKNFLADINDEEEYPELGKPFVPSNQKEISHKKENFQCQKEIVNKPDADSKIKCDSTEIIIEEKPEIISTTEKTGNKGKNDTKEKVHAHDPIKISFYEMLLERNIKAKIKDIREESDVGVPFAVKKVIKTKKALCNPVNLLDSSSPAIKRGKEREKPKPKKPSHLKKIILLDRKARKEHLLQLKNNNEEVTDENGNETKHITDEDDDETCIQNLEDEDKNNIYNISEFNAEDKSVLLLSESNDLDDVDDLTEINSLNLDDVEDVEDYANDLSVSSSVIKEAEICALNISNEASLGERNSNAPEVKTNIINDVSLGVSNSPDSLLNSLINDNNKSDSSIKEKAAKILLHTRNFREYCNHLTSKDIDDAAYALLDDLARFQDRLHQKDPVKARMKKRMIYGVKEVKKHIKLRKLKCIIIAVDIENVETQGGLNDILNDIKASAADHHIPCVFALSRKTLGKVCHKPVPVSCIGIFNYEGSEANFKKMVELQTQSKTDYMDIFNALSARLTEKEAEALLRAKREAPETLRDIRADILSNFFMESKTSNMENESAITQPVEQLSNVTAVE